MVLVPQRFRHLGGSGLWLDAGSQRCSVTGSHFTDLSGAGVMVGGIGDPAQDNASLFTAANTVSGNTIVNVSQEYHGTAALIVGYATGTTLSHNLIANVSYSGTACPQLSSLGCGCSLTFAGRDLAVLGLGRAVLRRQQSHHRQPHPPHHVRKQIK